jgi:uncharacterized protein YciI
MSYFAVSREAGPAWVEGNGALEQPGAGDHAGFMNALSDEGLVIFAGPLAGSEHGRIRVLLIADAPSEAEIHRRLAGDPWALAQRLVTTSVEPWNLVVGAERLTSAQAACAANRRPAHEPKEQTERADGPSPPQPRRHHPDFSNTY